MISSPSTGTLNMFFLIISIAILLVVVILLLPTLSGLTKVSVETPHRHHHKQDHRPNNKKQVENQDDYQYGYVPPDELAQSSNDVDDEGFLKTEARVLKEKLQLHSDDIPIRIKLKNFAGDEGTGLRRRKAEKLDFNTDPNSYDYDLDELIAEETESARQNAQREFYKDQKLGGEKEEMV